MRSCCLSGTILFGLAAFAWAAEDADVAAVLAREIIGPHLAMTETQAYTEARVPPMPTVTSADDWSAHAERMRQDVLARVVFRGEAAAWRDAPTKVEWLETIDGGPGYHIKKLRYEALPALWIPALLYEPTELSGKVPVALNVNGHDRLGKAVPYKQIRCINQAKRGMLALNVEWLGMGQLQGDGYRHSRMNQLDLCGSSGLAPFYLVMKRGLDILLSLEHADPTRVAVAGLSGGGWQTIFISSLDTRVTLANPVAGYSSFRTRARFLDDLGDSEQTPVDLATAADYAQLTGMLAPRPLLLTYNVKDDCCFAADHALPPLLEAAGPIFKLYGKEASLRSHVNHDPGTHNFEKDNRQAHYRMLGDHFFADDPKFDPAEIPSDSEVKTKEQLDVELPEGNADFHTLALAVSQNLPRGAEPPREADAAQVWRSVRRAHLAEIVRAKTYDVESETAASEAVGDLTVTFWRLKVGDAWTVPAVELVRGEPKSTAILVADEGRKSVAAQARRLLSAGHRVLAVDPFYFGESKIAQKDYLFALLVSAVGDRPLGIQASQVAAISRWLQSERRAGPVTLVAVGPRSSTFALVAAALEEKAISAVELHSPLSSLKEVIEQNATVEEKPELFCFGLLEAFDVKGIAALVAPRSVALPEASVRAKAELAQLPK